MLRKIEMEHNFLMMKILVLILTLILLNAILFIDPIHIHSREGTPVNPSMLPPWLGGLEEEDLNFIRRFLLASGSLKEVAHQYGVSYPTVRLRLDRLIQKIQLNEQAVEEPYIRLVKQLAVDDKLDLETARLLIQEYRKAQKEES